MKLMRYALVIIFVMVLFLAGCKSVQREVDYFKACQSDVECSGKMAIAYNTVHGVVSPIASGSGLPGVAVDVLSSLAALLAGLIYGRKAEAKKRGA